MGGWTLPLANLIPQVLPASGPSYFHANQYRRLAVPQFSDSSSNHRLAVYETQNFTDASGHRDRYRNASTIFGARALLGDTTDSNYPVYRTGTSKLDDGVTLTTAVFDPASAMLYVYAGNPRKNRVARTYNLCKAEWAPGG